MTASPIPVLPLTEARTQLFRLAEEVLSGQVDRVCLTHRSQPDDLLLMRASAVAQLERELADLRTRVAPDARPLAGLASLLVSDDDLLAELAAARVGASNKADTTLGEVAAGLHYPAERRGLARVAEASLATSAAAKPAARKSSRQRGRR